MIRRLIYFTFIATCICLPSIAQSTDDPPVSFHITLKGLDKKGKKLRASATIKNSSNRPVAIDLNGMWYKRTFWRHNDMFATVGEAGSGYVGRYRILKTNEVFVDERSFSLLDPFFESHGKYRLVFTYGAFTQRKYLGVDVWNGFIDSNEVNFDLPWRARTEQNASTH